MFADAEAVERMAVDEYLTCIHFYCTNTERQTIHITSVKHLDALAATERSVVNDTCNGYQQYPTDCSQRNNNTFKKQYW